MRILVYGAGVLGCNLAHLLYKSQKDVTLVSLASETLIHSDAES